MTQTEIQQFFATLQERIRLAWGSMSPAQRQAVSKQIGQAWQLVESCKAEISRYGSQTPPQFIREESVSGFATAPLSNDRNAVFDGVFHALRG
jgi:hypothetical protein